MLQPASIIPRSLLFIALLPIAACKTLAPEGPPAAPPVKPQVSAPVQPSVPAPEPKQPEIKTPAEKAPAFVDNFQPSSWQALPGWREDNVQQAWGALLASCSVLKNRSEWQSVCSVAAAMDPPTRELAQRFFESSFTPYQVVNADGSDSGLVTGYYEPLLRGSRTRSATYRYPVFGVPDDLLTVDLGELYPELKNMRLRGRVEGRRVVPYYSRAQIESGAAPVAGKELAWVDDPVELFFLQIQGSGRVRLENGETLRVGYADQNGQPYRSIGRFLADRGDLPLERTSMQGIKAWAKQNPARLQEVLNYNASYVFFRELPPHLSGPIGALGVPLTARRSIAVDARFIPLGAPVFLSTTMPNSKQPLNALMMAQDTGGAIRGAVRADFFWGFGDDAGALAGRMRQSGRMWVLLPADFKPPN